MVLELERSELFDDERPADGDHAASGATKIVREAIPAENPESLQTPKTSGSIPRLRSHKNTILRGFKTLRDSLFSSLTKRIVFMNMTALAILLGAILYLNQFREGLIDARIESLFSQGRIIAAAIAGSVTAEPDAITIDPDRLLELNAGESVGPNFSTFNELQYPISPEKIAPVLRTLIKPSQTRARIYDPDGVLILDSRFLYSGGQIQSFDLPPISDTESERGWIEFIGDTLNRILQTQSYPLYEEFEGAGTQYPEVQSALTGASRRVVRQTSEGKLTVSVAVPVQRYRAVMGVLMLSTEGDDIDRTVREERLAILRIFLVAAIVLLVLSALLANTIANPLRRLSAAAIKVKRGVNSRVEIPDLAYRGDEIGQLSTSIGEMTNSLYKRIEAIERFAADVSHELKNPLTSLRSAAETLPLAKTEEARQRLLEIVQHDVKRLDRLITDISDSSRLDADLVRDRIEEVDINQLVRNVVDATLQVAHRRKKIRIVVNTQPHRKGYVIKGHENRLGQVFNNLLDNAISFIPDKTGLVSITISRDEAGIALVVEDNGPGIFAENPDRIFERFYTDRAEHSGFGQNSGLGLSISKQIIEAHGGTIRAGKREDGKRGARFTVILPTPAGR